MVIRPETSFFTKFRFLVGHCGLDGIDKSILYDANVNGYTETGVII